MGKKDKGNDNSKRGSDKEIQEAWDKYEKARREYRRDNPKGGKDS
jgi:hypothetical protein